MEEREVYSLLVKEIPGFKYESKKIDSVYEIIQHFMDITREMIRKKNHAELEKHFLLAEKILEEGSRAAKNAIENVYVFSLSNTIAQNDLAEYLPSHLYHEYKKQTCSCGI